MPYRNDIEALEARHDALNHEIRERTSERDELRRMLDLQTIATIRIATPCSADWNAMEGDDRVRYCATCSKSVYNISNMTSTEAAALIAEREGKVCVRYFQRKDGTILLQDCSVGVWKRRHRKIAALAIAAGAAATAYGKLHEAPPAPITIIDGDLDSETAMGGIGPHEEDPEPDTTDDDQRNAPMGLLLPR